MADTTQLQEQYNKNVTNKSAGDTGSNATTQNNTAASGQSSGSSASTPATTTGSVTGNASNMTGDAYTTARTDAINQMYQSQADALRQQYQSAYDQSQMQAQAAADKIPQTYQAQANDLAVQYERNRRNLNQQAAGNGLNTGTGSQMQLALNSQWQRDYGGVKQAQADAQANAELQMAQLKAEYESQVASALAQNDFQKAGALLDEYNNSQEWNLKNAQILAEFGDFSLYSALYGEDQANKMANVWKAQNTDLAWQSGKMTAGEYQMVTGGMPSGATKLTDTATSILQTKLDNEAKGVSNGGGSSGGGSSGSAYVNAYNNWKYYSAANPGADVGNYFLNALN